MHYWVISMTVLTKVCLRFHNQSFCEEGCSVSQQHKKSNAACFNWLLVFRFFSRMDAVMIEQHIIHYYHRLYRLEHVHHIDRWVVTQSCTSLNNNEWCGVFCVVRPTHYVTSIVKIVTTGGNRLHHNTQRALSNDTQNRYIRGRQIT